VVTITSGETPAEVAHLRAWTRNGLLHVTGLSTGEAFSVYTAVGSLVYHSIATSEEADIPLNAQGIYIVRQGNKTIRVAFN